MDFNPRTPCGVRRPAAWASPLFLINFNPRTPCGVRRTAFRRGKGWTAISIHAPLAGCDGQGLGDRRKGCISIHAPLAGCDDQLRSGKKAKQPISIHAPLAGCDVTGEWITFEQAKFQSTHPLRGATSGGFSTGCSVPISIHAPLAGCDLHLLHPWPRTDISIHAPLAGCDDTCATVQHHKPYFNPRTPCGVRHAIIPFNGNPDG